jgi:transposase
MKCSVISIDIAKNVFQVCALDDFRKPIFNRKVKRSSLLHELRQVEPTLVVMEACYSSNPWGRRIEKLGHTVKFIPAFMVKPFVVGNKNDRNDALAIAEAAYRPSVRFISVKPVEQQDIQSLQRIRERMIKVRTGDINQLRGLLAEYGEICPKTFSALRKKLPLILEDAENELSSVARSFILRLYQKVLQLNQEIKEVEGELNALIKDRDDYKRLCTIPGIGPIVAATILASVNDANGFKNGRQLAAWIGLTPKLYASGEVERLGKISKRGNAGLRKMLIHGARAVLTWCDRKQDKLSVWLKALKTRMTGSRAVVALANKLARIVWAVLANKTSYDSNKACA